MNLPQVRIDHGDHGDKLMFMMRQGFITGVIRSMWNHGLPYTVKWLSYDGPRSCTDSTDS